MNPHQTHTGNLKGIALMVASTGLLALNDTVTKLLTQDYPATQVWCLRTVFALLPIFLVVAYRGHWRALKAGSWRAQGVRAALFVSTTLLIVLSLQALPLADVVAIVFASPLFIAALSMRVLGERVGPERWIAVAVGFAGVLFIVGPSGTLRWVAVIPVLAALSSALRDMVTRRISATETSLSILLYSSLAVVVAGLALAPFFDWQRVDATGWGLLLLNGLFNAGAHFLLIEALRLGEASAISPYKYSGLVWGTLLSFLVWGYVPSAWVFAGAALVGASGIYLIRHERRAAA